MDGWTDGWKDGWMEGWMVGWMDGWMDGWTGGWMDGWKDGWMDEWMDGWMEGWKDVEATENARSPLKQLSQPLTSQTSQSGQGTCSARDVLTRSILCSIFSALQARRNTSTALFTIPIFVLPPLHNFRPGAECVNNWFRGLTYTCDVF